MPGHKCRRNDIIGKFLFCVPQCNNSFMQGSWIDVKTITQNCGRAEYLVSRYHLTLIVINNME